MNILFPSFEHKFMWIALKSMPVESHLCFLHILPPHVNLTVHPYFCLLRSQSHLESIYPSKPVFYCSPKLLFPLLHSFIRGKQGGEGAISIYKQINMSHLVLHMSRQASTSRCNYFYMKEITLNQCS